MKFVDLLSYLYFNFFVIIFFFDFIKLSFFSFFLRNYYFWKISIYADNYWFLYSNKKFLHELRYFI